MFDPAEDALFVHDEDRAVGPTQLFAKNPVLSRHLAVRPEIRDEGVRNSTQRFAPRLFGLDRITADSQDLAIDLLERVALRFVRRYLLVSGRGKRKGVKGENDIFASAVIAQLDFKALHFRFGNNSRHGKVGSRITHFQDYDVRHVCLLMRGVV